MPREANAPTPLPQPHAPEQPHHGQSGTQPGWPPLYHPAVPAPRRSGTAPGGMAGLAAPFNGHPVAAPAAVALAGPPPRPPMPGPGPRPVAEQRRQPVPRPGGLSPTAEPRNGGSTLTVQSPGGFLAKTSYRAEPARPFALMIAVGGVVTVLAIAAALAFWPDLRAEPTSADQGTAALPPPAPVPTNDTPPAPVVKPKKVVKPAPKPVTPVPTEEVPAPVPVPEPAPEPAPVPVPDPGGGGGGGGGPGGGGGGGTPTPP